MRKESKRTVYVVRDPKAGQALSYGPETQMFLANETGIKGPYTTFTAPGGEVRGFRELDKIDPDPTISLHRVARQFGYEQFPELPNYLKAVVMIARGKEEDAEYYLDQVREAGVSPEYIHQIKIMGESMRSK